jgi:hypothetical protein
MARVICDMSITLDGYVTGPNDSRENPLGDGAGMLHDWLFDKATDEDRAILQACAARKDRLAAGHDGAQGPGAGAAAGVHPTGPGVAEGVSAGRAGVVVVEEVHRDDQHPQAFSGERIGGESVGARITASGGTPYQLCIPGSS